MDVINPDYRSPDEEVAELLEGFLSESKLQRLAKNDDLDAVTYFELKIDTRRTSLSSLGRLLPNLQKLKLNNGFIPSIRDIGSGYSHLTVLWMSRSQLVELDGIGSLPVLKELYLAYNEVSDLSSIGTMDCLEVLDLEGNLIADSDQLENLALCSSLVNLTLEGNPVTGLQSDDSFALDEDVTARGAYRLRVWDILPSLKILDDEVLTSTESMLSFTAFFQEVEAG
ncbi:hypothetical protein DFJ73DRAFT_248853 [Zopfochytrium polystomum]|nr:hypothetical protein DFJ73DRAFT_248853 [Zopfochytrium polystomum]